MALKSCIGTERRGSSRAAVWFGEYRARKEWRSGGAPGGWVEAGGESWASHLWPFDWERRVFGEKSGNGDPVRRRLSGEWVFCGGQPELILSTHLTSVCEGKRNQQTVWKGVTRRVRKSPRTVSSEGSKSRIEATCTKWWPLAKTDAGKWPRVVVKMFTVPASLWSGWMEFVRREWGCRWWGPWSSSGQGRCGYIFIFFIDMCADPVRQKQEANTHKTKGR